MINSEHRIRQSRNLFFYEEWVRGVFRYVLAGSIILMLTGIVQHLRNVEITILHNIPVLLGVAFVLAFGIAWTKRPSLRSTAAKLDRLHRTHDRFVTALEIGNHSHPTSFETLALKESEAFLANIPPLRFRIFRKEWWALCIPVICFLFLYFYPSVQSDTAPVPTSARTALKQIAEQLTVESSALNNWEPIAQKLQDTAERMEQTAEISDSYTALKELSSLQKTLEALLQQERFGITPEELARFAEVLRGNSKDAAEAFEKGQLSEASQHLHELLEQLKQQGRDHDVMEALAKSLNTLKEKLTPEQERRVQEQIAEATAAARSGGRTLALQQAMQELSQALQQASFPTDASQHMADPNQVGRAMTLQEILDALEQLKNNVRSGQSNDAQMPKLSFSPGNKTEDSNSNATASQSSGNEVNGNPSSEQDTGIGPKINPSATNIETAKGTAQRITGKPQGQGTVTLEMLQAAGGKATSGRDYQAIYKAAQQAAENSMAREEIPLGSRSLVRRYFEGIRPQE